MPIDRTTARALVEAGYMPLSEYIKLFGDTQAGPDLVPSIEEERKSGVEDHIVNSSPTKNSAPSL